MTGFDPDDWARPRTTKPDLVFDSRGVFQENCKALVVSPRLALGLRGFSLENLYDGGPCFSRDIPRSVYAGGDDVRTKELAERETCGER